MATQNVKRKKMKKNEVYLFCVFILTVISNAQTVTTLAGSSQGFADGTGAFAQFYNPTGVATDAAGNVYVADYENNKIRKVSPTGEVSTFAGSSQGFADGMGAEAQFYFPSGVATDSAGNVYVADTFNNRIRKITPDGMVTTLAGSSQGFVDGTLLTAKFFRPYGVTTDIAGNVYVADGANHKIRKITIAGIVSTLAGSTQGFNDGIGTAARFNLPIGVTADASGNVFVADYFNHKIRKITPTGVVSTFAGSTSGAADGTGILAQFNLPYGVAIDNAGNIYVGDVFNSKIRKISPIGVVSTFAGSGNYGSSDGIGIAAEFFRPNGVATDSAGNVYVADTNNNLIRKITNQLNVNQYNITSKIILYPNPVSSVLTLQIENDSIINKIKISDLSGKIILNQIQNSNYINVENLAKGLYILEAYSSENKMVSKFIKD